MRLETKEPIDPNSTINISALALPGLRNQYARQRGVERNMLLKVHGGLGDQICCEPTLRFCLETFKDVEISLYALHPELFQHLKFKQVYNMYNQEYPGEDFATFDLFATPHYFITNFIHHENCHAIDFPLLAAFQSTVPWHYREIQLQPSQEDYAKTKIYTRPGDAILVHPGKTWQSKTFPAKWWNAILKCLKDNGVKPIIIGAQYRFAGSVEGIDTEGCLDLRDQFTTMETIALIQDAAVVLTNDSAPLHMAASGDAYIGYVTMARRPEYLNHVRRGEFAWRMRNFSKGGIWEKYDCYLTVGNIAEIGDELRDSWLPEPEEMAVWAVERLERRRAELES